MRLEGGELDPLGLQLFFVQCGSPGHRLAAIEQVFPEVFRRRLRIVGGSVHLHEHRREADQVLQRGEVHGQASPEFGAIHRQADVPARHFPSGGIDEDRPARAAGHDSGREGIETFLVPFKCSFHSDHPRDRTLQVGQSARGIRYMHGFSIDPQCYGNAEGDADNGRCNAWPKAGPKKVHEMLLQDFRNFFATPLLALTGDVRFYAMYATDNGLFLLSATSNL